MNMRADSHTAQCWLFAHIRRCHVDWFVLVWCQSGHTVNLPVLLVYMPYNCLCMIRHMCDNIHLDACFMPVMLASSLGVCYFTCWQLCICFPHLHLTTSKVMVIVWRLRGNIIWTAFYIANVLPLQWTQSTKTVHTARVGLEFVFLCFLGCMIYLYVGV